MPFHDAQIGFDFGGNKEPKEEKYILKDCIVDRGSKYTVTVFHVTQEPEVKEKIKTLKEDSYFQKATHNSYSYRIQADTGILVGKNDDGEQGAGLCILRELERANAINLVVVVTRYFGGIQLHADRFKNVIEATKKVLQSM